jgi:O-acetyl-ADP-ribose deacetylase (regulator of RNase III)
MIFRAIEADIVTLEVDAIVNAANSSLLGGGGVDGAIHRAAGPELLEACRALEGCATGQSKITPGFRLPARFVVHTVGPVWRGGGWDEARLLTSCYRTSLAIAAEHELESIAFPCISTGIYGYPSADAAKLAVTTVLAALAPNLLPDSRPGKMGSDTFSETLAHTSLREVVFCCFAPRDLWMYEHLLYEFTHHEADA